MTFDEQAEFLMQSIASHDRQIGENAAHIRELTEAIASLVRVTNQDAVDIQALARIAESHEQRISKIEETR